jgi:hypothetical protein
VSWLVDRCPPALKSEFKLIFDRYPEIARCISTPSQPILVRIEGAPIESLRTEVGGDVSGPLRELVEKYASDREFFDQIKQTGVFELCRPLSPQQLRVYRISDVTGTPPTYRLEEMN